MVKEEAPSSLARGDASRCTRARRSASRGAALALTLLLLTPSLAEARRIPLATNATQLRGAEASAGFFFSSAGDTELVLPIERSGLLSPHDSFLSIRVDGVTRYTARLANIGPELRVALPGLEEGNHELIVRAELRIDDDPCLERFEEGAWLTLGAASYLETGEAPAHPSLRDLPAEWSAAEHVVVVPPELSLGSAFALFELVPLITRFGATPLLAPGGADTLPRIHFRAVDDGDAPSGEFSSLERALEEAHESARAVLRSEGNELWLLGRSYLDVQRAFLQLGDSAVRELCPRERTCFLNHALPPSRSESERDAATVLTIGELGHPHGWTAAGGGTHTLRFVWPKPRDWVFLAAPELHLRIRHAALLGDSSRLSVRLASRPLATWQALGPEADGQVLKVKVPIAFWEDDAWPFELEVVLETEGERCERNDAWLTIEPSSGLRVERTESAGRGIAGFYARAAQERPFLRVDPDLGWPGLMRAARIAAPIATRTPHALWQSGERFMVHASFDADSLQEVLPGRSLDGTGRILAPDVDLLDTDVLALENDTLAIVPAFGPAPFEEVAFYTLGSPFAFQREGTWISAGELGGERTSVRRTESESVPHTPSNGERALRLANIVWLASLVLLGLLYLGRRRVRRRAGT